MARSAAMASSSSSSPDSKSASWSIAPESFNAAVRSGVPPARSGLAGRVLPEAGDRLVRIIRAVPKTNARRFRQIRRAGPGPKPARPSSRSITSTPACAPGMFVIHFADQRVDTMDETALSLLRRTGIGFVFQAINLIPHLIVFENVVLPGYLVEADRARVDAQVPSWPKASPV